MEPTRIAWLAGIIDGEGCLRASYRSSNGHRRYGLKTDLVVQVTSLAMIEAICETLDEMDIGYSREKPKMQKLSTKPAARVQIHNKHHLQRLLHHLMPYLVVKKPEAIRALKYLDKSCKVLRYRLDAEDHTLASDLKNLKKNA